MKYNPEQTTMFDDFAEGVFRGEPDLKVSGTTAETRQTSRSAAKAIKLKAGTKRRMVFEFIAMAGRKGATDEEMQQRIPMSANTQRPRRNELLEARLIQPNGLRVTDSGSDAVVWVLSELGKEIVINEND